MLRLLGLAAAVLAGCGAPAPAATAESGPPLRRIERQCDDGVVAEVVDAGPYTYVRYTASDDSEHWLASLRTEPSVGEAAGFVRYGIREQFRSRRLGRTFSTLYFGYIGRCDPDEVTP